MGLIPKQIKEIAFWEENFNVLKRGNPNDIVAIDYENFDIILTEGGLYNLFLKSDLSSIESIEEDLIIDIIHKFPNKFTFTSARSMAEFLVINILPYLKGETNPYGHQRLIP